jgi:hypothetical protein
MFNYSIKNRKELFEMIIGLIVNWLKKGILLRKIDGMEFEMEQRSHYGGKFRPESDEELSAILNNSYAELVRLG